jgi:uncharacterized membrane protein
MNLKKSEKITLLVVIVIGFIVLILGLYLSNQNQENDQNNNNNNSQEEYVPTDDSEKILEKFISSQEYTTNASYPLMFPEIYQAKYKINNAYSIDIEKYNNLQYIKTPDYFGYLIDDN